MKKTIFLLVLVFCFTCKRVEHDIQLAPEAIPLVTATDTVSLHQNFNSIKAISSEALFVKYLKPNKLDSLILMTNQIKQNNLVADFNGDGIEDIVLPVRNKRNNKAGLIFFHSLTDYYVIGLGIAGSALENIRYTKFEVDNSKIAYQTVIDALTGDIIEPNQIKLINIALHMQEDEGTSGLLSWNGSKYIYIHTGD